LTHFIKVRIPIKRSDQFVGGDVNIVVEDVVDLIVGQSSFLDVPTHAYGQVSGCTLVWFSLNPFM
jgi:putative transposon-encoded protein